MGKRTLLKAYVEPAFKLEVRAAADKTAQGVSDFMRAALREAINDYRAPTPADKAQMVKVIRDLEGASRNLNQLARAANQAMLGQGTMPLVQEMEDTARRVDKLALDVLRILRIWA